MTLPANGSLVFNLCFSQLPSCNLTSLSASLCVSKPLFPPLTSGLPPWHSSTIAPSHKVSVSSGPCPKDAVCVLWSVCFSSFYSSFLVKYLPLLHYPSNSFFMSLSLLIQCLLTFSLLSLSSLGLVLKRQFPSLWSSLPREQLPLKWVPPTPH